MNIIITGASGGIGFEMVEKFIQEGHNVLAISRNEGKLIALQQKCRESSHTGTIDIFAYDLTKVLNNQEVISKEIKARFNSVDILINNAALLVKEAFKEINLNSIQQQVDINFTAPTILSQLIIPFMTTGGHIVNIGSMAGYQESSKAFGLSIYSATKGALAILTECMAKELEEDNIICNCLALGAVQTEMLNTAFPGYDAPIKPNEMADFVYTFATKTGKFMNGKIIPVSLSNP